MYEHLVDIADFFEPPKYVLGIGVKMEDLTEEEKDALKMSQDYWDKHLISRITIPMNRVLMIEEEN